MKDVLICCTRAEGSQLEWLAKALLDTGWSVTFMHKGSSGVASANCVIAVWSPHSVGDAWLTARAKTAACVIERIGNSSDVLARLGMR